MVVFRGGFRRGRNRRTPPPNLAKLTDQLLFSLHLAKVKEHAIYLAIYSQIFHSLPALVANFTMFMISNTDRLVV